MSDPFDISELRRDVASLEAQAAELHARVAEIEARDAAREEEMRELRARVTRLIVTWNSFADRYGY